MVCGEIIRHDVETITITASAAKPPTLPKRIAELNRPQRVEEIQ